jgi:hypothetical protein
MGYNNCHEIVSDVAADALFALVLLVTLRRFANRGG